MYTKYIKSFLILITVFLISCGSSKETADTNFENTQVKVYEVFGMDCPGCHGGVEKLLNKHEAVAGSKADWVKKQITLYIKNDSEISDEEIFALIKKANFTPGKQIKDKE